MNDQRRIAQAFLAARREDRVLATYPGAVPQDLAEAYQIQDHAIELSGQTVSGWKVGRVPQALVERHGEQRLAGPIFSNTIIECPLGGTVDVPVLRGFAAAEAELLLRVSRPLPPVLTLAEAPDYVAQVRFGIEIASSPFRGINDNGPAVTVSDFGNNHGLVLGPEVTGWRDPVCMETQVSLFVDGEVVGTGRPSGMLDGPLGSLAFLARLMAQRGIAIEEGQWISTGALTGVHPIAMDAQVEARFGKDLIVRCTARTVTRACNADG